VFDLASQHLSPIPPEGLEPEAAFGYAVAVDGDQILVGAPLADRHGVDAGAVFSFHLDGTGGEDLSLPGHQGDQAGVAVALDGRTALIGARYAGGSRGAAYLVRGSVGALTLQPREGVPSGAQFGFSVAIQGDTAVVGAFRENGTGAAYLFHLEAAVELDVATEVQESKTELAVNVRTRDGNPVPRDFTFHLQTLAGTAEERPAEGTPGTYDYLRLDLEVTLQASETATQTKIQLYPDNVCEQPETFQVILSDLAGTHIQTVEVTIRDDDSAGGLELSPALLSTPEDGTPATLLVHLTCQPDSDVTVSLSSSDPTAGTVSPGQLTFTSVNWATDQPVQVTGQDDALCDGLQTYSVGLQTTSADSDYAGLSLSVPAETADDELACLSAVRMVCTDGFGTVVYTISLANTVSGAPDTPAELRDILPPGVSLVTASADRGTATADTVANSVRWIGPVPATITIVAVLDGPPGSELDNQANASYVRDGRGHHETLPITFSAGECGGLSSLALALEDRRRGWRPPSAAKAARRERPPSWTGASLSGGPARLCSART
ncbi:MAG TPA: Calx-beta domain-containing protein, partial [Thermoanaerobaculia bacterium]|nr:Calx-beta domain-containing protein [Thermoanaerobaculia bacterium]